MGLIFEDVIIVLIYWTKGNLPGFACNFRQITAEFCENDGFMAYQMCFNNKI